MARVRGLWIAESRIVRCGALWLCVACAGGLGTARASAQDQPVPTLHAYTNLVQIPTLVLDQDRKPFAPIAEGRFFVSIDGGARFRVTHVRLEGDDPISLGVVLDVSQPYPSLMTRIDDAIAGLAPNSLHMADRVSIYSMNCGLVRTARQIPAEPAAMKSAVDRSLESWRVNGRDRWKKDCRTPANLWDSLQVVSAELYQQRGRRVILVVTDGVDRGSKLRWNALRTLAQERGVAIFGLLEPIGPGIRSTSSEDMFNSLCELTGGLVLTAKEKSVAGELTRFATMLRGRYIVEFPHPVDTVGGMHSMDITVEGEEAFIRPAGIAVPVDDAAVLKDPTTVPADLSRVPQLGKRKVLTPN